MGRSSPPFLYDPPSTWSFDGPAGNSFNPKSVTQASWTPRQSRPKPDGPLVSFSRHPDSWGVPRKSTNITPMSPRTKIRVKRTRLLQLLLRIATLVGALAALFCVICVNGTEVSVGWIIRVGPAVATLHTIYAIYHLCRPAASRPPASTVSYMLFASSLDAGLIPFWTFTAFVANRQYTENAYNWGTLFNDAQITSDITHVLFFVSTICGGLHVVSMMISIYLAIVFRQIARLPPDMNPLEDNLTARPHKRNKSEISEKHRSQSTLDSSHAQDDPLIEEARTVPFMHTRQGSTDTSSGQQQSFPSDEKRASHRLSRSDLPSQQRRLYEQSNQSKNSLTRSSAHRSRDPSSRPGSLVLNDVPVLRPSSSCYEPTDFRWGSPVSSLESDNWVAYPSRPSSPVDENDTRRPSPLPSQNNPIYSGVSDWLSSAQKYGRDETSMSQEKARGEYTALRDQEDYENDENAYRDVDNEQDLGERHQPDDGKAANPLAMNPPTPQPKEEEPEKSTSRKGSLRRLALTDLPNPSVNSPEMPPITRSDAKGRFYGELASKAGLSVPRAVSKEEKPPATGGKLGSLGSKKLWRRRSGKSSAYESLKVKDDDSDSASDDPETPEKQHGSKQAGNNSSNDNSETDRKGRVVSNSGIDLGAGFQLGSGSNSYSSYISGLGVGRRRDREVSGKVAEEGRGGSPALYTSDRGEEDTPEKKRSSTIRAAGWARFSGL
ncbi:hypothetical protein VTN77DRAFT_5664 [Rasamsonia byssochlamydoides]|uniref:uncharacterized protein n=1 Tax=Rasamsonia byssochlamydoides TaxID=89139 RepID=UPI0037448D93